MSRFIDRVKLFNRLAVINAPPEANEYKAEVFGVINSLPSASVEVVRCEDCRHANECHKSVQYTHNEQSTITIGYTPIEWCSRGEHKGGDSE